MRTPTLLDEFKSILVGLLLCVAVAWTALHIWDVPDTFALLDTPAAVRVAEHTQGAGETRSKPRVDETDRALTRDFRGS